MDKNLVGIHFLATIKSSTGHERELSVATLMFRTSDISLRHKERACMVFVFGLAKLTRTTTKLTGLTHWLFDWQLAKFQGHKLIKKMVVFLEGNLCKKNVVLIKTRFEINLENFLLPM